MKSTPEKTEFMSGVVFITHQYGPWRTGGERYNQAFLHMMEDKRIRIDVWTTGQMPFWMRKNRFLHNFWYVYRIRRNPVNVLIVDHYLFSNLFIALWYARRIGKVRIIGIVHHVYWNWYFSRFPLLQKCMRKTEAFFIKQFHALLVPSRCTLDSVKEMTRVPPIVSIVPPGSDRSGNRSKSRLHPNSPFRLLFVGMLHKRKGIVTLIHAVAKADMPLSLSLVGTGTPKFEMAIRGLAARLGLDSKVQFHGRMEGRALDEMYENADVFIMPSWHEGYGIALVEAMRYGLPIIASRICSFSELVQDGINGLLVPPGDVDELASAIQRICSDHDLRIQMGKNSRFLGRKTNTWRNTESQFCIFIENLKGRIL